MGRIALIAAALLLPVAGAWSLSFNDATADRVYGATSLTAAGTLTAPDGLAFDASGNLYVADSNVIRLFLSPKDTTAGGVSKTIVSRSIDSAPTPADSISIRKLTVTTTETDVLWMTFSFIQGHPLGSTTNQKGGVAGVYIPASLTSVSFGFDTFNAGRGENNDTLADIIIGAFRPVTGEARPDTSGTSDTSISDGVGGVTAKESGDTITLFVADRGNNRVLGYNLNAPRLQNMVFGGTGDAASNDSRADIVVGQDAFTTAGIGASDSMLNAPVDVAWCASRLLIADANNFRVVATDVDSAIADTFGVPTKFAFGDSDGQFGSVGPGSYNGDTGFTGIQQIFCDGVSLAVSDSNVATANLSGRLLVFTLDSDTSADQAIGGTLDVTNRTFTPNAAGVTSTQFRTLRDISGASGLIVVSDNGNLRVLGFSGTVGSPSAPAVGDGGTCLIEAALTGTSLEAALPWIRGARDSMIGSAAGRFLASVYYSVLGLAALALMGAGLAVAARRHN